MAEPADPEDQPDPEQPDPEQPDPEQPDDDEESLIDEMRGSGVGLEDPNIVSNVDTSAVDAHVREDEPPQV